MKTLSQTIVSVRVTGLLVLCGLLPLLAVSCLAPTGILPGGGFRKQAAVVLDLKGVEVPGYELFLEPGPGGKVVRPASDPVAGSFTFDGWYADNEYQTLFDFDQAVITRTTVVYAKWIAKQWKIRFYLNDGTDGIYQEQNVLNGNYVVFPDLPVQTGKGFGGWYLDESGTAPFLFNQLPGESLDLYAKWESGYRYIYFNYNYEGAPVESQRFPAGSSVVIATLGLDPQRGHYEFDGWWDTADCTTGTQYYGGPVNADRVAYAKWEAENYQVRFIKGEDSVRNAQTYTIEVEYGSVIPAVTPSQLENPGGLSGGTLVPSSGWTAEVNWGFVQWEYSSEGQWNLWNFNTRVTGPVTLYGRWIQGQYTATLECMNDEYDSTGSLQNSAQTIIVPGILWGATIPPQTVPVGQQAFTSAGNIPSREGYIFDGWWTALQGGTLWTMGISTVTQNLTLYATWTADMHDVTFSANEGTGAAGIPGVQQVRHLTRATAPTAEPTTTPAKSFLGWYKEPDCTNVFNFNDLITRNTTIYAKWHTTLLKTVTLVNPHTMETIVKRVDRGVTYTPSGDSTLTNKLNNEWKVVGWYLPGEEYTTITSIQVNEDVTLRARTQPHTVKYWVPQVTGTTPMLYILPRVLEINADALSGATVNHGYFTSWPSGTWGQVMAISPYPANGSAKYFTTQVEHGALAPQFLIWTAASGGATAGDIYFRAVGGTPNNGRKDWRTVSQSGAEFSFNTARITANTELYLPDSQ